MILHNPSILKCPIVSQRSRSQYQLTYTPPTLSDGYPIAHINVLDRVYTLNSQAHKSALVAVNIHDIPRRRRQADSGRLIPGQMILNTLSLSSTSKTVSMWSTYPSWRCHTPTTKVYVRRLRAVSTSVAHLSPAYSAPTPPAVVPPPCRSAAHPSPGHRHVESDLFVAPVRLRSGQGCAGLLHMMDCMEELEQKLEDKTPIRRRYRSPTQKDQNQAEDALDSAEQSRAGRPRKNSPLHPYRSRRKKRQSKLRVEPELVPVTEQPNGLEQIGNTCYILALFQVLSRCQVWTSALEELRSEKHHFRLLRIMLKLNDGFQSTLSTAIPDLATTLLSCEVITDESTQEDPQETLC